MSDLRIYQSYALGPCPLEAISPPSAPSLRRKVQQGLRAPQWRHFRLCAHRGWYRRAFERHSSFLEQTRVRLSGALAVCEGIETLGDVVEGGVGWVNLQSGEVLKRPLVIPYTVWKATVGWNPLTKLRIPNFEKMREGVLARYGILTMTVVTGQSEATVSFVTLIARRAIPLRLSYSLIHSISLLHPDTLGLHRFHHLYLDNSHTPSTQA